jgi:cell division protein FtsI (penicillin-binding protein 3)
MEKISPVKEQIMRRSGLVFILFVVAGLCIIGSLVYIQYGPEGAELRKQANNARTFRASVIEAERGDIFSYDGRLLATSLPSYDLKMDFLATGLTDSIFNRHVDSLAFHMSRFFGDKSQQAYKNMLASNRQKAKNSGTRVYRVAPRLVSYFELSQVRKFPILRFPNTNRSGFLPERVNRRVLPYGTIAARTIGRVVNDSVKWGIEGSFDQYLHGTDGMTKMQRISGSFWMPVADDGNREPVNGVDVVSTIDIELQDVAERALRAQLQTEEADWGTAVLMEVATGEIRAMANLSRRRDGTCVEDLNHAIAQRINPGSTFKLASLIVLLEDGGMDLDDMVNIAGGDVMIYGKRVRDSHLGYQQLTLRQVFEVSSNVGFARAVNDHYRSDQQRFMDQLIRTGIADTLHFQLAGERGPYFHRDAKKWSALTLTSMSYGYELEVTPMQTLALYNAVANDGKMIRPIVVNELRQYGQTQKTFTTETIRESVCSPATLAKVQECLKGVATEGTAKNLKIEELEIAVKTGTAQIPNQNRGYGVPGAMNYLATIVGYFPADNPKYTCIVCLKTFSGSGRGANYYGGSLAGPVFKAIAERVYGASLDWQEPISKTAERSADLPKVKAGPADEIRTTLSRIGIPYENNRSLRAMARVSRDTTGMFRMANYEDRQGVMPDVTGFGLRDALRLLEERGLVVVFSGKGAVVRQSIPAGNPIARGQSVNIVLKTNTQEI